MKTKRQQELLDAIKAAGGGIVMRERPGLLQTVRSLALKGRPEQVGNLHYSTTGGDVALWLAPHPGYERDAKAPKYVERTAPEKPAATRRGPPRKAETRGEQFAMRLSAEERARLERVAGGANRKPSDFARLAVLAAIEDAERAAKPKGCPSCGAMHYPHADWCPASLIRPETAEPATVGGQVASKSIARRLAFSGGPPPACTCPMADSREEYGGHLSECPRGAYEAEDHEPECPLGVSLAILEKSRT